MVGAVPLSLAQEGEGGRPAGEGHRPGGGNRDAVTHSPVIILVKGHEGHQSGCLQGGVEHAIGTEGADEGGDRYHACDMCGEVGEDLDVAVVQVGAVRVVLPQPSPRVHQELAVCRRLVAPLGVELVGNVVRRQQPRRPNHREYLQLQLKDPHRDIHPCRSSPQLHRHGHSTCLENRPPLHGILPDVPPRPCVVHLDHHEVELRGEVEEVADALERGDGIPGWARWELFIKVNEEVVVKFRVADTRYCCALEALPAEVQADEQFLLRWHTGVDVEVLKKCLPTQQPDMQKSRLPSGHRPCCGPRFSIGLEGRNELPQYPALLHHVQQCLASRLLLPSGYEFGEDLAYLRVHVVLPQVTVHHPTQLPQLVRRETLHPPLPLPPWSVRLL
eukprot:Sspe_Gene.9119::Locus_3071_Transcript_4_4_Confidence_0.500_Length_3082::g.9119::m.9119